MNMLHYSIVIGLYCCTGWCIAQCCLLILFHPLKPVRIGGFTLQGIVPARQVKWAGEAIRFLVSNIEQNPVSENSATDSALLNKLKPEIEAHVDNFLQNKMKTIFPLLSQFMGEKTLAQFKVAFMEEIDILFPSLMKKSMTNILSESLSENHIETRINKLQPNSIKKIFYNNAKKEILYFKLMCTGIGLLMGLLTVMALICTGY